MYTHTQTHTQWLAHSEYPILRCPIKIMRARIYWVLTIYQVVFRFLIIPKPETVIISTHRQKTEAHRENTTREYNVLFKPRRCFQAWAYLVFILNTDYLYRKAGCQPLSTAQTILRTNFNEKKSRERETQSCVSDMIETILMVFAVWFSSVKFCFYLTVKWKSLSHVQLFETLWISPGQNTGVGSLSLLQGIIPTQG